MPEAANPTRHWFHVPIQTTVAAFCLYWYWHLPAPNKAVLWLGGVAAIMALVEMRPVHKAIYFMLIIALMFTENRAIDKDRRDFATEQSRTRDEENRQFSGIGDTITSNVQRLLDNSAAQFNTTIAGVNTSIKTVTGGDSMCWISATPSQNILMAIQKGQYPLRGVVARMTDLEQFSKLATSQPLNFNDIAAASTTYEIGDMATHSTKILSTNYNLGGDKHSFNVFFSGLNGFWTELLRIRRVKGEWVQAIKVIRNLTDKDGKPYEKVVFQSIDKKFPTGPGGKVEWN